MTSNQIAYAATVESQRHNKTTEDETIRHNKATEDLATEANAINADKNRITENYNTQMVQLQESYNKWYAKYSEATTRRKLDLEAEGNLIKQQMADADAMYKQRTSEINAIQASIADRKQREDARHNVSMEIQNQASISNEWWFRNWELQEKSRANDLTATYYENLDTNTKRGQDLTFDANVVSALVKSGLDLGIPGFKIGIKGLGPMTTLDLFNQIIGDRYGSKEKRQTPEENRDEKGLSEGSGGEPISGKILKSEQRLDSVGEGRSVPGKLR